MSESHCPVVKMVGGEVGSSSSGQQAREQKRSAGRQLGGGDDDFDYVPLRRCSLCVRVSGLFCCRVRVRVTC